MLVIVICWKVLTPPVCTEKCWMYRQYSRLWQENVQRTICSSLSWSASCFSSVFSPITRRVVDCLMVNGWLRGNGWFLPPFIANCYFIGRYDPPWPSGCKDLSYFWIWPGQHNLAAFLLQIKIIVSSCLGPAKLLLSRQIQVQLRPIWSRRVPVLHRPL